MRKLLLLLSMFLLMMLQSVVAQTLDDYVLEYRGDTLVVKDDYDYGQPDALHQCVFLDTVDVPTGRVYMLKEWGYYSINGTMISSETRKAIIMGETHQSVKTSQGAAPPVLCGVILEGSTWVSANVHSGYDLLVKNINVEIANSAGNIGWGMFNLSGPGKRLQVDNCLIEHNLWTVSGSIPTNSRIFYTNDYFVNLDGHSCRRNGGVLDFFLDQDTIFVENCTHVNVQGSIYKSREYKINRQIFNHNNFINCCGFVFMNLGMHSDFSVTNNIFVNCNVQPFAPVLADLDPGEVDPDDLPMGLVNVYDDSLFTATGASFYVDRNLVYWDPSLDDVASTVASNRTNDTRDWVSQMIAMNSRSQEMFDDDETYPLLTEGTWIKDTLPNFADTDVLFTDQLAILKAYAIACVDEEFTGSLASWRQPDNPEATYFTYCDWPVPIDLSYDDADLLTAGLNGFPVGDLNWFPTQYEEWKAQRSSELEQIHNTLYQITAIEERTTGVPQKYQLQQNYPNPFNPTTNIEFTIPKAGNVSLKVYNSLGQEVATLVNEYKAASNYKVDFDASKLSSGIYYYTLKVGNSFIQTKKMALIK